MQFIYIMFVLLLPSSIYLVIVSETEEKRKYLDLDTLHGWESKAADDGYKIKRGTNIDVFNLSSAPALPHQPVLILSMCILQTSCPTYVTFSVKVRKWGLKLTQTQSGTRMEEEGYGTWLRLNQARVINLYPGRSQIAEIESLLTTGNQQQLRWEWKDGRKYINKFSK